MPLNIVERKDQCNKLHTGFTVGCVNMIFKQGLFCGVIHHVYHAHLGNIYTNFPL